MVAWIKMIQDEEADTELELALTNAKTPHGTVDNVMRIHSLRPSTMKGHLALYKSVLHDKNNILEPWFQETLSTYVSLLNSCNYSVQNHWKNAEHLIGNHKKSREIYKALLSDEINTAFSGPELAFLKYAKKLTLNPQLMEESDTEGLKQLGVTDGEILEANQIICYFNYVNRTINGLGVTTDGDTVGYYT